VVIDVGITRSDDGFVGDVDFDAVSRGRCCDHAGSGRVGPMTIACPVQNTNPRRAYAATPAAVWWVPDVMKHT